LILVDANLLVYARVADFPAHERAREWLDARLNGTVGVGFPWQSLLAFVRLVTNPRVFQRPMTMELAWGQVREWMACPPVWCPTPTDRHADILEGLIARVDGKSNLVPDAHLAALAMEYGLVLQSTDHDFSRFQGLRWENPLA
jgi:toxin-antitoxin system PIN domain toxin